jgi:hypothetical protein
MCVWEGGWGSLRESGGHESGGSAGVTDGLLVVMYQLTTDLVLMTIIPTRRE